MTDKATHDGVYNNAVQGGPKPPANAPSWVKEADAKGRGK